MNVNLFLLFGLVSTKDQTSNLRYNYALPHRCNIQVHTEGLLIIIKSFNYRCSIELVLIVIAMEKNVLCS